MQCDQCCKATAIRMVATAALLAAVCAALALLASADVLFSGQPAGALWASVGAATSTPNGTLVVAALSQQFTGGVVFRTPLRLTATDILNITFDLNIKAAFPLTGGDGFGCAFLWSNMTTPPSVGLPGAGLGMTALSGHAVEFD